MARRGTKAASEGTRLLDLWSPPNGAGAAIGCVSTTFTFDAAHFEEQCLARFVSMESSPDESAQAYLIEREEKFSQVFCCVLVDQSHARATRSLRWHLLPVRIPGAIQHAKLTVLLWERHLRILVGSANLTVPAYRTNYETVASLDFSPDQGAPLSLAHDCMRFLAGLAQWAPGNAQGKGPKSQLLAFLDRAGKHISGWSVNEPGRGQPRPVLVPLLPRESGPADKVPDQLSRLWQGSLPHRALIVSPFFDQSASALDRVYQSVTPLLTSRGDRSLIFRCVGERLPDKRMEVAIPCQLFAHPKKHPRTEHLLECVSPRSKGDEAALRPLHTKTLVLEGDSSCLFLLGSSNFTVKGLGLDAKPNAEVNLAYVIPASAHKFLAACKAALPQAESVENLEEVSFLDVSGDSGEEDASCALLPTGFDEALFEPRESGGLLLLRLVTTELPTRFNVLAPGGQLILSDKTWDGTSTLIQHATGLPVSCLTVQWQLQDESWASADWVVNVTDLGLLPPPSELARLDLEDLIAILTSARPIHWILAERLAAREAGGASRNIDAIDPHRKVDTSRFLMRRMRRLASALEGLRSRLEAPVATLDGLRWRLQGPFGPLALAKAIRAEGEAGAPFFIAEIVGTLRQLQLPANPGISKAERDQHITDTLRELRELALQNTHAMAENLREYVSRELAGIPS